MDSQEAESQQPQYSPLEEIDKIIQLRIGELSIELAQALRFIYEQFHQRLTEIEKSCGLMVDHGVFMERALVRFTEAAQQPINPEAEEWRESLGPDDE